MHISEPSLGGDQGPYKEATCTIRPGGLPNEHGSHNSRTHTVEDLSGSLSLSNITWCAVTGTVSRAKSRDILLKVQTTDINYYKMKCSDKFIPPEMTWH